jgi:hypothetical protein
VYIAEPLGYWTGRFVALCDKSKAECVAHMVSIADMLATGGCDEDFGPQHESFETTERRRLRSVLEDLRACCQSELALRSFEKFEDTLLMMKSGQPIETMKPAAVMMMPAAGTREVPNTISKLRHPWLFGSTSSTSTISSASKTSPSTKIHPSVDKPNGLVKSKTTGYLAEYSTVGVTPSIGGSAALSSNKSQHTRQPSNLSIQAQMNARALREREGRATRRAEEIKKRVNSTGFQVTGGPPIVRRADHHPNSERVENPIQQVKQSPRGQLLQELPEHAQARRPSDKRTTSTGRPDKQAMDCSENRGASVTDTRMQTKSEVKALKTEVQMSGVRTLNSTHSIPPHPLPTISQNADYSRASNIPIALSRR